MKRVFAVLVALLLASACSLAEEAPGEEGAAFEDRWICGRAAIDIEASGEGRYRVEITWGSGADEDCVWRYDCAYDATADALVGTGDKLRITFGDGGEAEESETLYEGGEAAFTLDGEGRLLWADAAEDAGADMAFERVVPEGDGEWEEEAPDPAGLGYVGDWSCGDFTLEIGTVDGRYTAQLRRPGDDATAVEWVYDCDVAGDVLEGHGGAKYVILSNEEGLEISSVEEYDGGTARFALTPDGGMTWQDDVEDAGRDLVFERTEAGGAN